ncbi:hypothetical protein [Paraburkholderia bannensis]|uniref:hypothetical protein n=1 Tax=Paraburkholderia bannensis TaxID=765414 RepID=UPI002AB050FE|nr:hypothetical protein [Paraburkholderia bannensis]
MTAINYANNMIYRVTLAVNAELFHDGGLDGFHQFKTGSYQIGRDSLQWAIAPGFT